MERKAEIPFWRILYKWFNEKNTHMGKGSVTTAITVLKKRKRSEHVLSLAY